MRGEAHWPTLLPGSRSLFPAPVFLVTTHSCELLSWKSPATMAWNLVTDIVFSNRRYGIMNGNDLHHSTATACHTARLPVHHSFLLQGRTSNAAKSPGSVPWECSA